MRQTGRDSEVDVKLYSKQRALDSLPKIHALFREDVVHSDTIETPRADYREVLVWILEQATDEERALLEGLAERLSGTSLPSEDPELVGA